jgi:hypothetical protein
MITVIVSIIFATFFVIFAFCMIWEQWNIINNDTTCKDIIFNISD